MPDFTVIEGGGQERDWEHEIARQHFEQFALALLRSLASGERVYQLMEDFFAFFKHAKETGIPIRPVFEEAVRNLQERAFGFEDVSDEFEEEWRGITQAGLRVIADTIATDAAANARRAQRRQDLERVIDQRIIAHERRARLNGWSYVEHMTKWLGEWPRQEPHSVQRNPRKPRAGKRRTRTEPEL